jgi:hypothetical protein
MSLVTPKAGAKNEPLLTNLPKALSMSMSHLSLPNIYRNDCNLIESIVWQPGKRY